MGIRAEYEKNKKRKFRVVVGSRTILIAGITTEEAEKKLEETKKQKGAKSGKFFELLGNIEIENMEV